MGELRLTVPYQFPIPQKDDMAFCGIIGKGGLFQIFFLSNADQAIADPFLLLKSLRTARDQIAIHRGEK